MNHVAVVFDKKYLIKALTLYASAIKNIPDSQFWFLCMDEEAKKMIENLQLARVHVNHVEDINDTELLATKANRTPGEFAWTSKAAWLRYLLHSGKLVDNDNLFFIDADIFFYSSVEPVLNKFKNNGSIAITHHKFSPEREQIGEIVGYYNSGFIIFKVGKTSRQCIEDWRKQCLEWCHNYHDKGRHGDQKYLDKWPDHYQGVLVLPDKGVNTGTWNIKRFTIEPKSEGRFLVDGTPLVCYHFHGLQIYLNRSQKVKAYPITIYHSQIYSIYIDGLQAAFEKVIEIDPSWRHGFVASPGYLRLVKQKITQLWRNW